MPSDAAIPPVGEFGYREHGNWGQSLALRNQDGCGSSRCDRFVEEGGAVSSGD